MRLGHTLLPLLPVTPSLPDPPAPELLFQVITEREVKAFIVYARNVPISTAHRFVAK